MPRLALLFVGGPLGGQAPAFSAGEEGDVTNLTVAVTFTADVVSGTNDYVTGVTIRVNGVAATINSGTRQSNHAIVYYVLAAGADANDEVTFEYSDVAGDIAAESDNTQMGDIAATAVTNNVGRHLRFNDAPNSMHLATVGA